MKKLEIVIKAERLDELKEILTTCDVQGLMLSNVMGYGNQKGYTRYYRGAKQTVNFLPKIKVETIVDDETSDIIVKQISKRLSTGEIGDGKIFLYDVADVVRIRTGEHGEEAI